MPTEPLNGTFFFLLFSNIAILHFIFCIFSEFGISFQDINVVRIDHRNFLLLKQIRMSDVSDINFTAFFTVFVWHWSFHSLHSGKLPISASFSIFALGICLHNRSYQWAELTEPPLTKRSEFWVILP